MLTSINSLEYTLILGFKKAFDENRPPNLIFMAFFSSSKKLIYESLFPSRDEPLA
jgi:hypothetical protein